ncbi:hypothetical protein LG634_34085 [Streptomyces bambusae]|uniref:NB-ARC domain-containing protein n=1 Tax=Streptomyces bambusae TaxID=1550616 RepID=UPI001D000A0D|nr:NB-ARC domain-containing protein [Streptomyces bambusae]MCB5169818.1 hypothetical protein [Streptomyces bambusae]
MGWRSSGGSGAVAAPAGGPKVKTAAGYASAALAAVVVGLFALAANAATAQSRWPGVLDVLRRDPWPWVYALGGGTVVLAVLALLLPAGPAGVPTDPPPPAAVPVPAWVVNRDEGRRAVSAVCGRRARNHGAAVGITTSLEGAGGFGKTTLAGYVGAHPRVRRHFRGRVYTVTIGRDVRGRAAIAQKVAEATAFITGDTTAFDDPDRAGDHLGRLLDARPRTLLVLDDVWEAEQLGPFLRGGSPCTRLVTTRVPDLLPDDAVRVRVDEMTPEQARAVLTWGLPELPAATVAGLLAATGRWALLLRLANRLIAGQVRTGAEAGAVAAAVLARLRTGGPAAVDRAGARPPVPALDLDDPARRALAVRTTVEAATTLLPADGARRCAELGVFVEDELIPVPLVVRYWEETGGLSEEESRFLIGELDRLSLVSLVPDGGGRISLHDVLRDYLRGELGGADEVARLHRVVVEGAIEDFCWERWETDIQRWPTRDRRRSAGFPPYRYTGPGTYGLPGGPLEDLDGYLLDHLVEHLLAAGQPERAVLLAGNLRWVELRLDQRGPSAPWTDLSRIDRPTAGRLARDLAQTAHLLTPTEPPGVRQSTLYSRLGALDHWRQQVTDRLARLADERDEQALLVNHWDMPDLPDPALLRTLTGTGSAVRAVVFGPDGAWVASGGEDGVVVFHDPETGRELARGQCDAGEVLAMAASADGGLAVAGTEKVCCWTASVDRRFEHAPHAGARHDQRASAAAAAPDSALFVTVQVSGRVWLWQDGRSWESPLRRRAPGPIKLAIAQDGRAALASGNGVVEVRPGLTGNADALTRLRSEFDVAAVHVSALCFAPDREEAIVGDEEGRISRIDLMFRTLRHAVRQPVPVSALAVAPRGVWFATGGTDGMVRLWDRSSESCTALLSGHRAPVATLAVSPDGSRLASGSRDGTVRVWDARGGGWPASDTAAGAVAAVAVTPSGAVITAGEGTGPRFWAAQDENRAPHPDRHAVTLTALCHAPSTGWTASAGGDGRILVWDDEALVPVRELHVDPGGVRALALAPSTGLLASLDASCTVRLWDVGTGESVRDFSFPGPAHALAVSADGVWLAVGENRSVRMVPLRNGREPWTVAVGPTGVRDLAFSPQSDLLACAGGDGLLRLWRPERDSRRTVLDARSGPLRGLAFSPDGRWLAAVGDAPVVHVWDVSAERLHTGVRTEGSLTSCAWTADGAGLAVGGERGLYFYEFRP